jgi:hypothetical protein
MRRRILFPLLILATVLLAILLWRLSQDVDVGYVMDVWETTNGEPRLHVVELPNGETKGKTREEILELIDEKSSEDPTLGASYSIPWINHTLKSKYEPGDRVRIYWSGWVNESDPPQIPGTSLILKSESK